MEYRTASAAMILALTAVCGLGSALPAQAGTGARDTITFKAADGLAITADLYPGKGTSAATPVIIAFHQAGSSRGEYRTIAPKLAALGYTVLAPDQRSGQSYDGVKNKTAARAKAAGKPTKYKDALPDLHAALAYMRRSQPKSAIIIWGSSYSASLVLKLAAQPGLADAVLAFSPGEYYGGSWVRDTAGKIAIPTFITSARGEAGRWSAIFNAVGTKSKIGFIPRVKGRHGSSALHPSQGVQADPYWRAVKTFLAKYAPVSR